MRRLHAKVQGRVQGVGFRYYCLKFGRSLGLSGWVRNLDDGSVELLVEGEEARLKELLVAVRRGPPASRVESIYDQWHDPQGDLGGFDVR